MQTYNKMDLSIIIPVYTNLPVPFVFAMIYICLFFAVACCLDKVRLWCWKRISEKAF